MKKILIILLTILMLLTACGPKANIEEQPKDTEPPVTENAPEVPASKASETEKTEVPSQPEAPSESEATSKSEEAQTPDNGSNFELGKEIILGDYTVIVSGIELVEDSDEENKNLLITYNFINNSEETTAAFYSIDFIGYQDGVETDSLSAISDDVDYTNAQRDLKPGRFIENANALIRVDDLAKPIEIDLQEFMSLDNVTYTYEIADVNNLPEPVSPDPIVADPYVAEIDPAYSFALDQEFQLGDFGIKVTSLEIVDDWDGESTNLKFVYNFTNNSSETISPWDALWITAFQDGVETNNTSALSDSVDFSTGQADVKPGSTLENVEDILRIDDPTKPLLIQIEEYMGIDSNFYSMLIDDVNSL